MHSVTPEPALRFKIHAREKHQFPRLERLEDLQCFIHVLFRLQL